ncbi:unnamed protein product [Caenorhabditis nigoni]
MHLFILIATFAIASVVTSSPDNSTAAVPIISSDSDNSTFGDIDDSSSDDFSSDETVTSIHTNAHGIGTFQISSDFYSNSPEEQEIDTRQATGTLVEEADQQAYRLLQCWEAVDPVNTTSGFILSKPIFTLCSYIPLINSKGINFESFTVNGLESVYYTDPLLPVFEDSEKDFEEDYKAIVICTIEKLQFLKPPHPPSRAMRCLCNQSGCNVPEPFEEFLKFNRNVVRKTNNGTTLTDH